MPSVSIKLILEGNPVQEGLTDKVWGGFMYIKLIVKLILEGNPVQETLTDTVW